MNRIKIEQVGAVSIITHDDWKFERVGDIYQVTPESGVYQDYHKVLADKLYKLCVDLESSLEDI